MDGGVIVEFYGIPRQRAGRAELTVPAGTLGEVLAAVERACPSLRGLVQSDGRLTPHYLVSLEGRQFVRNLHIPLAPGAKVLLLSADVGG